MTLNRCQVLAAIGGSAILTRGGGANQDDIAIAVGDVAQREIS